MKDEVRIAKGSQEHERGKEREIEREGERERKARKVRSLTGHASLK